MAADPIPASLKPFFLKNKEPPNILEDYDAVGFDVNNCLVKYDVHELIRFLAYATLEQIT